LELIVDYVRWLSIRGNMEIRMAEELAALFATNDEVNRQLAEDTSKTLTRKSVIAELVKSIETDFPEQVASIAADLAESWTTADLPESVVVPTVKRKPPTKESLEHGRELFLSKVAGKKTECAECHGQSGRGDGGNMEKFWPDKRTKPERKYEVAGLH